MLFKNHNLNRARNIAEELREFIIPGERVLDIGLGNGVIAKYIKDNFKVGIEGVDIVDYNATEIRNTIYDGSHLPFADNSFDCIIILETLHHCNDMTQVLKETMRVCRRRIIIMEDIYENLFEKYLLLFHDYISNIRKGVKCPYYFQSRERWREIFKEVGINLEKEKDYTSKFFVFDSRHVIFVLLPKS